VTLAICLLCLGLGLVVAEVFFPSLGMLSILAAAAIIGSLVAAYGEGTEFGVRFSVLTALLLPATILIGLRLFPRSPMGKHMVAPGLSFDAQRATDQRDRSLEGSEGVVESDLRPAGHARLGGRRVDVVSRGESIPSGARVKVTEVRGNRVVVARIPDSSPSASSEDTPA